MQNTGRFVIHKHTHQNEHPHWDLMFEAGQTLETYRLSTSPMASGCTSIAAERIFDHHLRFLTYQGKVNKGTGSVKMEDSGAYRMVSEIGKALRIELLGDTLKCILTLTRAENDTWQVAIDRCTPK